jgi:amino acid adenylation domain-containing protein
MRRKASQEIPLLSFNERKQMLLTWNDTQGAYARTSCLHQLFEIQAEQTPHHIAAVFEAQQLTYRELNARANCLAHHLQALGLTPEARVAIYVERSLEMLIALLGVLKAGGAYVPLDPAYPQERIAFVLEDADVNIVLTQERLCSRLSEHRAQTICLDRDWDTIVRHTATNPIAAVQSDNLAYVIYTSGSTGKPKGVQIPHYAVVNFLQSMAREPGLSANDRLVSVTTLSFDIAALELFLPLTTGACVIVASREVASDGVQLLKLLDSSGASVMQATPASWRLLLEAGWQSTPGLKALCGGEALPWELAQDILARCSELWNMYGPTETTIWSSVSKLEPGQNTITIGYPIANTQFYVFDQQMQPVPIGVSGELYISGDGLARGYLDRPALTAEKFVPNPFSSEPGARLYRTGDLVRYRPDGTIEYLGRMGHQVKIRGFRIELGEIEAVLLRRRGVCEAVIVAKSLERGPQRLVAYVVPEHNDTPTTSELRSFLRKHVPDYMVPSVFVVLEALPLTPNGKVNRRALPEPRYPSRKSCGLSWKRPMSPPNPSWSASSPTCGKPCSGWTTSASTITSLTLVETRC